MENGRKAETRARINAINELVKAMERGIGRTIGYENEENDGYKQKFYNIEKDNFEQVGEIFRSASTLEEVAEVLAEKELYLDSFGKIGSYIEDEVVSKFFPREGYVSSLRAGGLKPANENNPESEFNDIIEIGKAWAFGKRGIDEVPDVVLLNDPAFVVGYIEAHSDDFLWDVQHEYVDTDYYEALNELTELVFEKMPVVAIQQERKANATAKEVDTNPNGRGE